MRELRKLNISHVTTRWCSPLYKLHEILENVLDSLWTDDDRVVRHKSTASARNSPARRVDQNLPFHLWPPGEKYLGKTTSWMQEYKFTQPVPGLEITQFCAVGLTVWG